MTEVSFQPIIDTFLARHALCGVCGADAWNVDDVVGLSALHDGRIGGLHPARQVAQSFRCGDCGNLVYIFATRIEPRAVKGS